MAEDKKSSNIFKKVLEASNAYLDNQIAKSKASIISNTTKDPRYEDLSNFDFGTAITKDRYQFAGNQGYLDRMSAVNYDLLKMVAFRSSIISGIIRTRQNLVASYSTLSKDKDKRGWRIQLKNEEEKLQVILEQLQADNPKADQRELKLEAQNILEKEIKKKKREIEEFIKNCGEIENKPFDAKKWNFDTYLRAIVYDSLSLDQMATEFIPKDEPELLDEGSITLSYFRPVDASTIRYASSTLSTALSAPVIGEWSINSQYDILKPEEQYQRVQEDGGKIEVDQELLDKGAYKYVQVVRGQVQRAFTEDQLALGIRNPITNITFNGYGLSEIEVMLNLITSHMQTEHYNISYFRNGFSAKGILHIKENLNRAKLEDLRINWNHMISGNKNSFQTPILSGMEEVNWIPLTQNHSEMEFNLWINYLIKMICSTFQIDPLEIGFGIKDAGGSGGGLSGDNSSQKLQNSRDKGFLPLMSFLASYINSNIMTKLDKEFVFEWTGLEETDSKKIIEAEEKEVKYKKTINEIRTESGLKPVPFGDIILDSNYVSLWSQFSDEITEKIQEKQRMENEFAGIQQADQDAQDFEDDHFGRDFQFNEPSKQNDHESSNAMKKSIIPVKIEYYKIKK
jgi:HK97 family phage portal protein